MNARRTDHAGTKGQGRPFEVPKIAPWPDAVDGAALLSEVTSAIQRYVAMPDGAAEIVAMWAMHTHCFDCFMHSPRLAITSPEKGCGKTTLLDVAACLVARPLPTSNATVSAIFRVVEMARPTLLIDEADTFLKENDELRGILNTGHRKGGSVLRTIGDDHEPRQFSTWGPAAIAMIGRLPDTLDDRSINCGMRRRKGSERVESFRSDRTQHLEIIAQKMARWAADHDDQLRGADPATVGLENRVADNWRPLLAIADAVGDTGRIEFASLRPLPWRPVRSNPSVFCCWPIFRPHSRPRAPIGCRASDLTDYLTRPGGSTLAGMEGRQSALEIRAGSAADAVWNFVRDDPAGSRPDAERVLSCVLRRCICALPCR